MTPRLLRLNDQEPSHLIVEPNTQLTVIDIGHHPKVQLEIGANATVEYLFVFVGDGATSKVAHLQADATLHWCSAILGGSNSHEIVTHHVGSGARSQHFGLFLGQQHDTFKMHYWSEHTAAHTSGHILVHGALLDSAYADFKGNIRIAASAKETDASLTEHTLLLGNRARSDSIPQLDIQTNAVRVTHSSAMTKVDDEQLFYMASRGLPTATARRMIVTGFLNDIVQHFQHQPTVQEIDHLITERIQTL